MAWDIYTTEMSYIIPIKKNDYTFQEQRIVPIPFYAFLKPWLLRGESSIGLKYNGWRAVFHYIEKCFILLKPI